MNGRDKLELKPSVLKTDLVRLRSAHEIVQVYIYHETLTLDVVARWEHVFELVTDQELSVVVAQMDVLSEGL